MTGNKMTDIHVLRTRWMTQLKAMSNGSGNLSRRQRKISGRAGRVAWKITELELLALCKSGRRSVIPRTTSAPDTFAVGDGNEQSV